MRTPLKLLVVAVLASMPASASAATLTKSANTLTYIAAAGRTNVPAFTMPSANSPSTIRVTRGSGDDDPFVTVSGCPSAGNGQYDCTQISRIVIDTGDGNDMVTAAGISPVIEVRGGAGDDVLRTGAGTDVLTGGDGDDILDAGPGTDTLDAGAGDDQLDGGAGSDTLSGGSGIDTGFYTAIAATPAPAVSLDGVANDGIPGENDDYRTDLEDVSLGGVLGVVPTTSTLTGNAAANVLVTAAGNDTVTGGAGNDTIDAAAGDDTIEARDAFADRVDCGPGTDVVNADTLDVLSASCETANVVDVGNASDDRPPTVAWIAPVPGARLSAAITLSVDAADDRGVAVVRFLDDERVVCEDTAAPFNCAYTPRGDDVGPNTLTAIAVDTSGQTASTQRAVTVNRFSTTVVFSVRPRSGTFTAGGQIRQPATVARAQACRGSVTVRVKAGGKTVLTRKAKLTSRCTFSIRGLRVRAAKPRFTAAFTGNGYMLPRSLTVSPTVR